MSGLRPNRRPIGSSIKQSVSSARRIAWPSRTSRWYQAAAKSKKAAVEIALRCRHVTDGIDAEYLSGCAVSPAVALDYGIEGGPDPVAPVDPAEFRAMRTHIDLASLHHHSTRQIVNLVCVAIEALVE
jgi:hypothetical protein